MNSRVKAYYHFNVGILCGSCSAVMYNDLALQPESDELRSPGGFYRVVYCNFRTDCPQYGVRIRIDPIEVDAIEI